MTRWISRSFARFCKRLFISPALLALALTPAPLLAVGPGDGPGNIGGGGTGSGGQPIPPQVPSTPRDVPEISTGAAAGAIMLLVGGTLLLTDHVRRRKMVSNDPST